MPRELYFFTLSFPYGIGELWKLNELTSFVEDFNEITIVPFTYGNNKNKRNTPGHQVVIADPVISNYSSFKKDIFRVFFSKRLPYYVQEFFSKKVFRKVKWLRAWLVASSYTEYLFKHPIIKRLLEDDDFGKDSVLYFFWSRECAYIIPFLKKNKFRKVVVRFHGYDLYEERLDNAGYIPFRRQLLRNITDGVFISKNGFQYLNKKHPGYAFSKHLFPLGAVQRGVATISTDGWFRIYTCSMLVPIKQLHILAQALCLLEIKVEWHHIGDGPERERILGITRNFPSNIKFFLKGFIAPDKVVDQYVNKPIDLFINVSESEGVPVSIMEALSAGIPVMATDVGGTHEIVNEELGVLIEKEVNADKLAKEINTFCMLSAEEKRRKREAALRYYGELWNAKVNSKKLSAFLLG